MVVVNCTGKVMPEVSGLFLIQYYILKVTGVLHVVVQEMYFMGAVHIPIRILAVMHAPLVLAVMILPIRPFAVVMVIVPIPVIVLLLVVFRTKLWVDIHLSVVVRRIVPMVCVLVSYAVRIM